MRFSARLTLTTVVPAVLFTAALGVSLVGLFRTEQTYAGLLAREERLAAGASDLYAQGLQMGQALRNIALDPADQKAQDNLKKADEAFDQRYRKLAPLAAGTPLASLLGEVASLRTAHQQAQQTVLAAVASDPASAPQLLKKQETPAWRALRAKVLDLGTQAQSMLADAHAQAQAAATRAKAWAVGLAGVALVAALAFLVVARRTMQRALGCEPEEASRILRRVAGGDLAEPLPVGQAGSLMHELGATQAALRHLVGQVRQLADGILTASAEVATGSLDLSSRTEQAASHLQETAASMAQISGSVQQGVASASEAKRLAGSASEVAQRGGSAVQDVVRAMADISDQSRRIGDITGVIDGIAFQTNILALNAAVEAARAGESGRGFAVVASEVRSLAQRSAEAAREIKTLIGTSVERIEGGASLVGQAGTTIQQVVTQVAQVDTLLAEITHATAEQGTGITQVSAAVNGLDAMTQQNAALVEESSAAAATLKGQAEALQAAVSAFRLPA